ncbi:MAG: dihydroxyacetone kinase subunit L [Spirochaetia bacterium]|jgi:dihydroxyacetone kinase-like protein|nr:dihydroxyacetone kinase subunit L [Spirochaetia bacterium]
MEAFKDSEGKVVVEDLIRCIRENREYLSEVDGLIGDGDHGINMSKGFTLCGKELEGKDVGLCEGLQVLGTVLLTEIGGSMGPLYGSFFRGMAKACRGKELIDGQVMGEMLQAAEEKVSALGNAKVGDKTLMDALVPAVEAYRESMAAGKDMSESLAAMKEAAAKGRDSTKDLVAKVGRAARLGERSRGVLDAGATSCALILGAMADSVNRLLGRQ